MCMISAVAADRSRYIPSKRVACEQGMSPSSCCDIRIYIYIYTYILIHIYIYVGHRAACRGRALGPPLGTDTPSSDPTCVPHCESLACMILK